MWSEAQAASPDEAMATFSAATGFDASMADWVPALTEALAAVAILWIFAAAIRSWFARPEDDNDEGLKLLTMIGRGVFVMVMVSGVIVLLS